MNKYFAIFPLLLVLISCSSGVGKRVRAYEHSEFGLIKITDEAYLGVYNLCESKVYKIPIDINGNQVSSKKDLDKIFKNYEVYFGSTVYNKDYSQSEIASEYKNYKETVPGFVHEIEELSSKHRQCMWEAGFTPDKGVWL